MHMHPVHAHSSPACAKHMACVTAKLGTSAADTSRCLRRKLPRAVSTAGDWGFKSDGCYGVLCVCYYLVQTWAALLGAPQTQTAAASTKPTWQ